MQRNIFCAVLKRRCLFRYDHDNKRPRGFGFVTFATEEGVDEVFTGGALQTLHDKPIEIKRAVPRDQIASARGRTAFNPQVPRWSVEVFFN